MGKYPSFRVSQAFFGEVGHLAGKAPQLATPMAPRIFDALKRYEMRIRQELPWSELGRRVWQTLGETGDSTKWVSRVKLGQQEPTVREAGAIAYVLDASPLWLCWNLGDIGSWPDDIEDSIPEPVATSVVASPTSHEEQRAAAKRKAAPTRRARGG
jgi:hypothetical protein